MVDDFTRECLTLVADTSLSGARAGRELEAIVARRGKPLSIVSESCPMAILRWSRCSASRSGPIVEMLNETLFASLVHAREALAVWKNDYNTERPHSAIGNVPPAVYAKLCDPAKQRTGRLSHRALRPVPLHH